MAFLELTSVSKGFGGPPVLSSVNLAIERGEFVAIVGYSGSGKTTLISLIAGLTRPDSGTVKLNDLEITAPGPDRGMVFQNYSLLPWLTVTENIALAVDQVFPNHSAEKRRLLAATAIATVNLTPHAHKLPRELSGGQRQRVSVARALAMDPQILLLDEPLSALDALTRATLQDEFERIWEKDKKTVVLITNDVDEALLLADRIIPLTPGPPRSDHPLPFRSTAHATARPSTTTPSSSVSAPWSPTSSSATVSAANPPSGRSSSCPTSCLRISTSPAPTAAVLSGPARSRKRLSPSAHDLHPVTFLTPRPPRSQRNTGSFA